jgi:hypothetical protein
MDKYENILLSDDLKKMAMMGVCPLGMSFKDHMEKVNYYYILEHHAPLSTPQLIDKFNTFNMAICSGDSGKTYY